ncbi:preprotein translocase subunit Sec61beta [Candidatus Woesearchaeota archaeon]|nr:preprotein translocase subunit Sec61beta [Candidatus Woesearchaeota archaeon]
MADEKITMPSSTAGITRYFDDYKSKIEFTPGQIVVACIAVFVITLLLHLYANRLLGLA